VDAEDGTGVDDTVADTASGLVPEHVTVLSVDKALLIVELLMREEGPFPAREIAARVGINRTTAHRLLKALIHRGWIEKPGGTASYRLGVKFLALAHVSTQLRTFLQEVRPELEHLSRLSRETVHVGVLDGYDVIHVDKIDSLERVGVSSKTGSRGTPHTTGLGKALLAAGPVAFLEGYLAHAGSLPAPFQVDDPDQVREEIRRTTERGYSIDNEEDSIGVRCIGVAVLGTGGQPIFAISLTGPSPRFTLGRAEEMVTPLIATAHSLSARFGWEEAASQATVGRRR
jgi:DNA-binding IclR family transcriptional regulator